MAMKEVTNQE